MAGTYKSKYLNHLERTGYNIVWSGCELCSVTNREFYDVHHIVFKSEMPKHRNLNNVKNLIYVCRKCHDKLHDKKGNRKRLVEDRELDKLFGNKKRF